jgi:hypothetical protein
MLNASRRFCEAIEKNRTAFCPLGRWPSSMQTSGFAVSTASAILPIRGLMATETVVGVLSSVESAL